LPDNKVEVFENGFKWLVRVREDGQVTERVFHIAEHAQSWAAGQEIRLNEVRRRYEDSRR
jgi:hypothetical protein